MELIHWNTSIATGLAGQATTAYTWLVLFMDTSELDLLLESPTSPEAFKYFSEHCVASHTSLVTGRNGSSYSSKLTSVFGTHLIKHLGAFNDDGQQEIRVAPQSFYFGNTPPRDIFAFYTPHYSLASPQKHIPIVWGTDFLSAELIQTFDECFIKEVRYSPGSTSTANQRPTTVRVHCLIDDVWVDFGLITGSGTTMVSKQIDTACSGLKLTIGAPSAGQIGWSIDTFYATTDTRRCITRPIETVLLCPLMYNVANYPTTLDWSSTRCPVIALDVDECSLNREAPSIYTPIVCILDEVNLGAIVL